jgi:DNA-binding NtrC family response regulator
VGRILVVEDEPGSRLLLQTRLEDLGHEVTTAPTGAMGLMEARAGRFDLFLVDVVLGQGVDGLEVTRRLRAMPPTHGIPIVLVSGQSTSREDLHRGYESGCSSFLIKSDLSLLEDVVQAMLRIKSLRDDLSMQNRLLEQQNRSLQEEKQRGADLELALRESGARSLVFRELAAGRPDGLLLVDADGLVRSADRGAREILGKDVEGKSLGRLAPASGLEAFVRDARTEPREGFRFDLGARDGRKTRSLSASVLPMVPGTREGEGGMKVLLLLDAGMRRIAAELLRMQEQGLPRRELGSLREAARNAFHPSSLLGVSQRRVALRAEVARVARADGPVLLRGEPGSGKELAARALHFGGERSGAFVSVSCGALGPKAIESELFGYVKGAFTGAFSDRLGLLHQAHMGTIYLDEVGDLPPAAQAGLLRVLEQGELKRVGIDRLEPIDVRVIAGSRRDLDAAARRGSFDPVLLQRLSAELLEVPPLRERPEDVPILVQHLLVHHAPGRREIELSPEALWVLESHDWPENVRELESVVERACTRCRGDAIGVEDLPQSLSELFKELSRRAEIPSAAPRVVARPGAPARGEALVPTVSVPSRGSSGTAPPAEFPEAVAHATGAEFLEGEVSLDRYEKAALLHALRETGGDRLAAARLLGVGKSTLYRKLKHHSIT